MNWAHTEGGGVPQWRETPFLGTFENTSLDMSPSRWNVDLTLDDYTEASQQYHGFERNNGFEVLNLLQEI